MADKTGQPEPDRSRGRLEIDSTDLQDIIREQAGDIMGDRHEKEPEVIVEDGESEASRAEAVVTREEEKKEPTEIEKALETIKGLQSQVDELKRVPAVQARRDVEPQIEFEEVVRNVRLPKDRSLWPIQLGPEDLKNIGIDPDIAPGMNILANALYKFVWDTLPGVIMPQIVKEVSGREDASREQNAFLEQFPDLKGQQDLIEVVEARVWNDHKDLPKGEYSKKLGEETRRRIATIRGMSYEDYVREVGGSRGAQPRTSSSRAVSAGGGRGRVSPSSSGQSREMEDLL